MEFQAPEILVLAAGLGIKSLAQRQAGVKGNRKIPCYTSKPI